jgi:hypothetical protein
MHTLSLLPSTKKTNKQPELELTALQMILSKNPEIIKQKIDKKCFVLPSGIKYLLQDVFFWHLKAATQQHGRVFRQIEDTFRHSPAEERFVVLRFC